MAREIVLVAPTGANWYAVITSIAGQFANGTTLEAYNSANWTSYAIALTDTNSLGIYAGDFPALTVGRYQVLLFLRAGATPATTDAGPKEAAQKRWDGTNLYDDMDVSTILAIGGSGAYTIQVPFVNAGTVALQGVKAAATKNGITIPAAPTGTLGLSTFNLDIGTYTLAAYLAGYSFGGATLNVTGGNFTAANQIMTLNVITPPASGFSTGVIVLLDGKGNVAPGDTLTVQLTGVPTGGTGVGYDSLPQVYVADVNGLVTATVPTGGVPYLAKRANGKAATGTTPLTDSVFNFPDVLKVS